MLWLKLTQDLKTFLVNELFPIAKASEFLDYHHRSVILDGSSNIKNSGNFLNKL